MKELIRKIAHGIGFEIHKYNGLKPMSNYVNNNLKGELVGVEIGTHIGLNAEQMLKKMNLKKLYIIDPYTDKDWKDGTCMEIVYGNISKILEEMQKRLEVYFEQGKCLHLKTSSSNAASEIPNELDFVYVDGNHDYEHTLQDLRVYYSKLKQGGVLGGHDFNSPQFTEVTNAVIDFAKEKDLQLYSHIQDFWFIKGRPRQSNDLGYKEREGEFDLI